MRRYPQIANPLPEIRDRRQGSTKLKNVKNPPENQLPRVEDVERALEIYSPSEVREALISGLALALSNGRGYDLLPYNDSRYGTQVFNELRGGDQVTYTYRNRTVNLPAVDS
jgi:hypothetical protein